ncbi:MAG: hypothetical protein ACU826_07935 [Gammaproteobacteria bacterium]
MPHYYQAFGLQIRSKLELPELLPGEPGKSADIQIRLEKIPAELPNARRIDRWTQIRDELFQLEIDHTARYQAIGGNTILVDPDMNAQDMDVRLFLLGSVFGAILHQRKLLPLHASVIAVNRGAVAFAGDSGAGKSTLAAFFQRRGYKIVSDDICLLAPGASSEILAFGAFPRLKLWRDAIDALEIEKDALIRDQYRLEKFHVPLKSAFHQEPLALKSVYLLQYADQSPDKPIEKLSGVEAMSALMRHTYRPELVAELKADREHFWLCAEAARTAGVYRLNRRRGAEFIEGWLDRLESHWEAGAE